MKRAGLAVCVIGLVFLTGLFAHALNSQFQLHPFSAIAERGTDNIPLGYRTDTFAAVAFPSAHTPLFAAADYGYDETALFAADLKNPAPSDEKRTFSGMVIPKQAQVPKISNQSRKTNGFTRAWNSVRETAIMKRVGNVCSWVGDGLKLLWAVPKAVVKGDSRSLIEAIGNLLSRASASEQAQQQTHDPESESMSDEVDDNPIQSRHLRRGPGINRLHVA